MDHDRYPYSPIVDRPALQFPNGARVAVWVVPIVEHFHIDKPATSLTELTTGLIPDVLNYSWRDFGVRVGIWRLMEIMEKYAVRGTVALNSEACLHYPQIIEAGNRLKWEWMGHGRSNSLMVPDLDPDQQPEVINEALNVIEQHTGTRPKGWLSPALSEAPNTLDVLADLDLTYVADWANDEQPYEMTVKKGSLLSMPCSVELNDLVAALLLHMGPEQYFRMITDHFDVLYADGAKSARVMALCVHPFIAGQATRSKYFDAALKHITSHTDVWLATGSEIAEAYRARSESAAN